MIGFVVGVAICLSGGLVALAMGRWPKACCTAALSGMLIGGALTAYQAVVVLASGGPQLAHWAWLPPLGSANMGIDPLSAVFVLAIVLVTMLAAIYGAQYLQQREGEAPAEPTEKPRLRGAAVARQEPRPPRIAHRNLGPSWFFFNLLAASMLMVVTARNGVLFLASWEVMSLASFFLVMQDDRKESVRRAGWIYLVAMHMGTAFLVAMFLLMGRNAASLDFDQLSVAPEMANVLFVLAVIGFGTKAGFIPLHVWLPEAHPAAPSHVSAVMSGVMIKTGIYGLLRMLTLLGEPPAWWGWTLVTIGVVSGVLGVLNALAQHDLKRLLAYHSVENIGIIALGLGVGLLGITFENPTMAALGFAGSLLHVVNHAIFKSLLFLGAGSVLHATGTAEMDRLGGLLKRMPVTGATFLLAAAAISGLPPLNGFVSEFLIYLGAMAGLAGHGTTAWPLLGIAVVGGLALIGGLAAACFTKAFGIAFLGEPRSEEAARAHEAGAAMRWPMVILASLCVVIGLAAPLCPLALQPAVAVLTASLECGDSSPLSVGQAVPDTATSQAQPDLLSAAGALTGVMLGSYLLLGFIVLAIYVRRQLLSGRRVESAGTWDCGYAACTPRMQYTASSFARPLTLLFRLLLQPHDDVAEPRGLFPEHAHLHTHTPDVFRRRLYDPLFAAVAWAAFRMRWLQQGRIQIYVLYIALTILALLIWKLG